MENEKRLIDANALDEKVGKLAERYAAQGRMVVAEDYNFIRTVLMTAPTVDAVEVVRCKDCKHFIQEEHGCNHFGYYSHTPWVDEVGFCSYGEKRDGDGNG
jgi:hypothetical protein